MPDAHEPRSGHVVTVIGLAGIPELDETDDLGAADPRGRDPGGWSAAGRRGGRRAEGRLQGRRPRRPAGGHRALGPRTGAGRADGDPAHVEVILGESREVVRSRPPLVISETRHGFVCASAGVDASNAAEGTLVLLPLDPDASARRLRERLVELSGVDVGVIVSDSFGRAWRQGTTDVALGVAASRRCATCAASATRAVASCARPRSRSPTRSRARRSS